MEINDVNCVDRSSDYTARELKFMSEINTLKISLELAHNQIKDLWTQKQKSVDLKKIMKQLYDITQTNHYGDASIAYSEMKEIIVKCMEEIKMSKCRICGREISKGKYCSLCEMKSQIIFKGSVSDVVKKITKKGESNVKSK